VIVLVAFVVFSGCAGSQCIKIGGSYDGIDGNLEYCWGQKASEDAKTPVLVGEKTNLTCLTDTDMSALSALLGETGAAKKIMTSTAAADSPVRRVIEIIRKYKGAAK